MRVVHCGTGAVTALFSIDITVLSRIMLNTVDNLWGLLSSTAASNQMPAQTAFKTTHVQSPPFEPAPINEFQRVQGCRELQLAWSQVLRVIKHSMELL